MNLSLWNSATRQLIKEWKSPSFSYNIELNILNCWESLFQYSKRRCGLKTVWNDQLQVSHIEYTSDKDVILISERTKVHSDIHDKLESLCVAILSIYFTRSAELNATTISEQAAVFDRLLKLCELTETSQIEALCWSILAETPQLTFTSLHPVLQRYLDSTLPPDPMACLVSRSRQLAATSNWMKLADKERWVLMILETCLNELDSNFIQPTDIRPISAITTLPAGDTNVRKDDLKNDGCQPITTTMVTIETLVTLASINPNIQYRFVIFPIGNLTHTKIILICGADVNLEDIKMKICDYWQPLVDDLSLLERPDLLYARLDGLPDDLLAFYALVTRTKTPSCCCHGFIETHDSNSVPTATKEIINKYLWKIFSKNKSNQNTSNISLLSNNSPFVFLTTVVNDRSNKLDYYVVYIFDKFWGDAVFIFNKLSDTPGCYNNNKQRLRDKIVATQEKITAWVQFVHGDDLDPF